MKHDEVTRLLYDYLDEALSPGQVQAVEAHLADCAECREEVEALSTILTEAKRLPKAIEPERDLWPDIDAQLDVTPLRERTLWSLNW